MASPSQQKQSAGLVIHDLRIYESLGSLVRAYRRWRDLSQEAFAAAIGIGLRELQRWEANRHCARIANLHDLAETTGIPMQVVVALNSDQPIWYSLRKRQFAYSSVEEAQFVKFVIHESHKYAPADEETFIKHEPIATDKHLQMILSCHRDIYGPERSLGKEVIRAASAILPALNRIAFDSWGHYAGHQVCLPIETTTYQTLKKQQSFEGNLTAAAMSDIVALRQGVLYFYSICMPNVSIAQTLLAHDYEYLASLQPRAHYIIARIIVTSEAKEIYDKLGAKVIFKERETRQTEIESTLYEHNLEDEMRRVGNIVAAAAENTGEATEK
jgi:hypothetical protein